VKLKRKAKSGGARTRTAPDRESRSAAVECARIADARRGKDIVVLHIEDKILVTDYFVIASAANKRQIQAIAFDVRERLREAGYREVRIEGYEEASWVLVDCGPVVVHVFREDLRSYYDLELLWGDAPKVSWKPRTKAKQYRKGFAVIMHVKEAQAAPP